MLGVVGYFSLSFAFLGVFGLTVGKEICLGNMQCQHSVMDHSVTLL